MNEMRPILDVTNCLFSAIDDSSLLKDKLREIDKQAASQMKGRSCKSNTDYTQFQPRSPEIFFETSDALLEFPAKP